MADEAPNRYAWSRRRVSNPRPPAYKAGALPAELRRLFLILVVWLGFLLISLYSLVLLKVFASRMSAITTIAVSAMRLVVPVKAG